MRGFFGGLIMGLVVAVVGTAALSLLVPRSQGPVVGDQAPVSAPQVSDENNTRPADPNGADADLVEALPTSPSGETETTDGLGAVSDTDPAEKPQVGDATADIGAPDDNANVPNVAAEPEDPQLPQTAGSSAPEVPLDDASASSSISTDPSQPPMPNLETPETGFATSPPEAGETPTIGSAPDDGVSSSDNAAVNVPTGETAPNVSTDPGSAPQPDTETAGAATPEHHQTPKVLIGGDAENQPSTPGGPHMIVVTEDTPRAAPDADTSVPEAKTPPAVAELPQAGTESEEVAVLRPGLGTPVVPLTERGSGAVPPDPAVLTPAIEAYAEPYDDPGTRPLMSIVLIDDEDSIGAEALKEFPYPITFAIDPEAPDAADKMAIHRAAGFEVVLMANLAKTAMPQDAEVSFGVWLETLPETVAILGGTGTGLQGNRALSDQVTDIALSTGRGLIFQANGLNTAQKMAAREGVPSGTVFRDFDGAGQTPTIMRRFLDQAAFRARQEAGVIMLGRVRPDTISALVLWGLQDRAQRVALVPVSATLLQNVDTSANDL